MTMSAPDSRNAVTNSAYTTFQTDKPVTYLLPVSYVAATDLSHPRVTGAPQLNNFILVDYASLGTAANDPLRRALDLAANDANNFTALQTALTNSNQWSRYGTFYDGATWTTVTVA